jgi:cytoskeletal protein CcmA (bactofilin family)
MSLPTIIPSHMRINGRIATSGDLVIEGRCAGTIEVGGTVTIAPGAHCEALIRARDARVDGNVAGTIVCRRAISVGPGAHVVGSLEAPTVEVHPAARILGTGTPFDDPPHPDLEDTNVPGEAAPAREATRARRATPARATTPARAVTVMPARAARPGKRVRIRGACLRRPSPPAARARAHQAEPQAPRTAPPLPRLPERVRVSRRDPARRRGAPQ